MAINLTNIENEYTRIQTAKADIATTMNNAGANVSATNTIDEIAVAVSNTTTELRAVAGQLTPNFANNIDELNESGDTSKLYVLPDGYIYAYTTQVKEIFTDVLTDVGYTENMRLTSSGTTAVATSAGSDITGYIPCKTGDIIYLENMEVPDTYQDGVFWYNVSAYDSEKTHIKHHTLYLNANNGAGQLVDGVSENGNITQFTLKESVFGTDVAYIMMSVKNITADSKIYVNSVKDTVTEWTNTNHKFVANSGGGSGSSEDLTDLENRVSLLEANSSGVGIPEYWLSELETKANSIQIAMEKAGRNKSAFLWYTDAHWVNGNSKMSPVLLNYLYKNTPMNKVNFGGDIIGDTLLATRDEMKYLYEWREAIKDLPNHHSVLGNHDMFASDSVDYEDDNYRYAFMIAPEESSDMVMGEGNYYYIDNPCEKTRYLHFAYLTSGHTAMMTQGQFMIDAIKGVPEGWHIVAIAHRWWQYSSSSTPTTGSIPTYEGEMLSVFDAYNARTTREASNYFTAQDFTEAKGKVEFCIAGHIHVDYDIRSTGGIPIIITTADTNQNRVPDSTVDSGTVGTTTESAVFGIIADYNDPENTKITVIGVGRGTSRIIYEDQETAVVTPTQIYDLTYQLGDVEVGSTIDTSQISYMVSYSDGTESEGGSGTISVSPTTVQSVGNNEITVTYTENGISVSETLFIKGIETSIEPSYENKILTSIESDGTPYNGGTGYKEGYRLNSTGVEKAASGMVVSGFIPYNGENIELTIPNIATTNSYNYLHLYDSSFAMIAPVDDNGSTLDGSYHGLPNWVSKFGATMEVGTDTTKYIIPASLVTKYNVSYLRTSAYVNTTLNETTFNMALISTGEVVVTPTSLSNIVYNGSTTVGTTINKSDFSFTVNYSDGSSTNVTGATNISPTTIENVGDNVVTVSYTKGSSTVSGTITIVGEEAVVTNLFNKDDTDIAVGHRIRSNGETQYQAEGQLVTGWIEVKAGDTIVITSDKACNTNSYTGVICCYGTDKVKLGSLAVSNATISADALTETMVIPTGTLTNSDFSGTTYMRCCIAYTDINNISITKS